MKIFSFMFFCIFAIGASPIKAQANKLTVVQLTKFVAEAKEVITDDLLDPGSAQFRKLYVATAVATTLCGEINTKNRMGAYTGYKLFYVVSNEGRVSGSILVDPEDSVFRTIFTGFCSAGGTPVK